MVVERNPSGLPNIGRTLVSARSFDEYVAMFDLTNDDLTGSILDCPGGAASFAAEARNRGASVVAVDPVYAGPTGWLAEHAIEEAIRGNRHTASSIDSFAWTFFADIDDHLEKRTTAASRFGQDLTAHPATYVAGSLPRLPFRDASFDLVLSSHLLFMYADRLDEEFHIASALEMARVARREVRIFPLIADEGTDTTPLLIALRGAATARGYATSVRPAPYEFQKGGDQMLVIARGSDYSYCSDSSTGTRALRQAGSSEAPATKMSDTAPQIAKLAKS